MKGSCHCTNTYWFVSPILGVQQIEFIISFLCIIREVSSGSIEQYRAAASAALLGELSTILRSPQQLSVSAAVCAAHGKDESYHHPIAPDAVVYPESTAQVSAVRALIHALKLSDLNQC